MAVQYRRYSRRLYLLDATQQLAGGERARAGGEGGERKRAIFYGNQKFADGIFPIVNSVTMPGPEIYSRLVSYLRVLRARRTA